MKGIARILTFLFITLILIALLFLFQPDSAQVIPDFRGVQQPPWPLTTPQGITNPVLTVEDVTDIAAPLFIADPFMFHEDDNWYMFFEIVEGVDYDSSINRVNIGLATSTDGLNWEYKGVVLDEPEQHLSFPGVYKYNGTYYMIPSTNQPDGVHIYAATDFPYKWTHLTTILDTASLEQYLDPSLFYYNNKWWMFVGSNRNKDCHLFYSDDLLSGWVEHPMSPVIKNDSSKARPGGRAFVYDNDKIMRVVQKDDSYYGEAVRVFQVDRLTVMDYVEYEIPESPIIWPNEDESWRSSGSHTFDPWWTGDRWLCVVDGVPSKDWRTSPRIWSIGIMEYVPTDTLKGDAYEASRLEYHWLEAEYADFIVSPLEVAYDENASAGKYIYSPNGTGNQYKPDSIMATYTVDISRAGGYLLWGRVSASTGKDDSFFIQIDNGSDYLWEVKSGKPWHWDAVNERGGADPVKFTLSLGLHTLKIKVREDGTKLDKLLLTNNVDFVPSGKGTTVKNQLREEI